MTKTHEYNAAVDDYATVLSYYAAGAVGKADVARAYARLKAAERAWRGGYLARAWRWLCARRDEVTLIRAHMGGK